MISLDWKERLVLDSQDYMKRKIPVGDYDFDIIFNAYPERIDNKIPRDVIVLVATTIASKMSKNYDQYKPFLEYIWDKKGENGKLAFACIISRFVRKNPEEYLEYIKPYLFKSTQINDVHVILEKVVYPLLKKTGAQYFDILIQWIRENNEIVSHSIIKTIVKVFKNDPECIKKFTQKMENRWLNANPYLIKINSFYLKQLQKIDEKMYLALYDSYKTTREPIFVEILTGGLSVYSPLLESYFENWAKSGNARVKKAGVTGLKFLTKKKGS